MMNKYTHSHSLIADSWPDTLLDEAARRDLNWTPEYDLAKMVAVMTTEIQRTLNAEKNSTKTTTQT